MTQPFASVGCSLLVCAFVAGAASCQEPDPIQLGMTREWDLVVEMVSDDAARAEAASRELASRGPASLKTALQCALMAAGRTPANLVATGFDPVGSVRLDKALEGIARMGRAAVPELTRLVTAGGAEGALAAITLGLIGPPAAPAAGKLLAAVPSDYSPLSWGARKALAKLGPPAVRALLTGLSDTNAAVREAAAEALGELAVEPARSVPALTTALRDPESDVRAAAAKALGAFGPTATPAVKTLLDPRVGEELDDYDFGDALARIVADPGSLKAALHADDARTRERAAWALGQMPAGTPVLVEALASGNRAVRLSAVQRMRPGIAGATVAESVARLLADGDPELRKAALVFILNLGPDAAHVLPAVAATLADPEPAVRAVALQALGELSTTPAQMAPAVPMLRDPVLEVRTAAAQALSRCPAGPASLKALLDLVQQPDAAAPAARALGALGMPEALAPLRKLLDGNAPELRRAAARGLALLGPKAAPAADSLLREIKPEEPGHCDYWIALGEIGPAAARKLAEANRILGEEGVASCEEQRASWVDSRRKGPR
jgi:HEAT repeat protein